MLVVMVMIAVCHVFMSAAILSLNLNRAVADLEIMFQHVCHILMNLFDC